MELMRIDLYGLVFDTPQVTFHLWSPWRAAELEHRLFKAVCSAAHTQPEQGPDEWRVGITETKSFHTAIQAIERVLKGWQEEAEMGNERRNWRWLLEADSDADGYDHTGAPTSILGLIGLSLERGSPDEGDKGEDVDMEGFGMRVWGLAK
jgi:hypothetical protein